MFALGTVLETITYIIHQQHTNHIKIQAYKKFADDTTMGGKALSTADREIIQKDLN